MICRHQTLLQCICYRTTTLCHKIGNKTLMISCLNLVCCHIKTRELKQLEVAFLNSSRIQLCKTNLRVSAQGETLLQAARGKKAFKCNNKPSSFYKCCRRKTTYSLKTPYLLDLTLTIRSLYHLLWRGKESHLSKNLRTPFKSTRTFLEMKNNKLRPYRYRQTTERALHHSWGEKKDSLLPSKMKWRSELRLLEKTEPAR